MDDLLSAIDRGDLTTARELAARDPGAWRLRDAQGLGPIIHAVYQRRRDIAVALAELKGSLDVFEASALGRADQLRELLAAGPDLAGSWSADGFTPLHLAAFFGEAAAVRVLLEHGADPTPAARNDMRVAPLNSAAAAPSLEIARMLLDSGAPPDPRQTGAWTPLHEAAHNGDAELVRLLLERGADPAILSDDGRSPADMAAEVDRADLVELLKDPAAR